MRLVIKNSIQLCLRTLVFSIVLRHSNYNNSIISIEGTFLGDTLYMNLWLALDNWPLQLSWLERCTGIAGPQIRFCNINTASPCNYRNVKMTILTIFQQGKSLSNSVSYFYWRKTPTTLKLIFHPWRPVLWHSQYQEKLVPSQYSVLCLLS